MRLLSSRSFFTQKLLPFKGNTLLRRTITALTLAMFVLLMATSTARGATIIYVDASASGGDTGLNWTDAYPNLQDALAAAASGDEIWVADGVYYPDEGGGMTNDDRTMTFTLIDGVGLYGGFAGGETSLSQRDWGTNVTVLSGDIDQNDTTDSDGVVTDVANIVGSNAYHVVTGGGTNSSAVLDGFTITAGVADGSSHDGWGGGMINDNSSPTLTNLTFSCNQGSSAGGMVNYYSNPTLTNVIFTGSRSGGYGGGMRNNSSSPTLLNVTFLDNQALNGGGVWNHESSPTLINVTFSGNKATLDGGGMLNSSGSSTLTNVTFSGNQASMRGGGIYNHSSSVNVMNMTNGIFWNNQAGIEGYQIYNAFGSTPQISYSDIQGSGGSTSWDTALGIDLGFNIDANPLFVTPVDPATAPTAAGDLHLQNGSPAVDTGLTLGCPSTDLDGNTRPIDGDLDGVADCDMGAYEKLIDLFLPLVMR